MAFVLMVGLVIVIVCVVFAFDDDVGRKSSLALLGLAAEITIAAWISFIPEKERVHVDNSSDNYPSAYEEAEEMSRGTCSYAQESSSDNLSCDAGE